MAGTKPKCSCPDHETHGGKWKHIFAVEHVIQRELNFDGSETVTETIKVTATVKRTAYPQNWPILRALDSDEGTALGGRPGRRRQRGVESGRAGRRGGWFQK